MLNWNLSWQPAATGFPKIFPGAPFESLKVLRPPFCHDASASGNFPWRLCRKETFLLTGKLIIWICNVICIWYLYYMSLWETKSINHNQRGVYGNTKSPTIANRLEDSLFWTANLNIIIVHILIKRYDCYSRWMMALFYARLLCSHETEAPTVVIVHITARDHALQPR